MKIIKVIEKQVKAIEDLRKPKKEGGKNEQVRTDIHTTKASLR